MSDAQRSRAKRTVVEGSGRLIPFGRSRVLEIDAQAMPSRPAAAAGFSSLFAGGTPPVILSFIEQPTVCPFILASSTQYLALHLYPHIIPGNHHVLFCCLLSLSCPRPPTFSTTQGSFLEHKFWHLASSTGPIAPRSSHHMLCCVSPQKPGVD